VKRLTLLILLIFTGQNFAQNLKNPIHLDLSKAHGFLVAQDITLNRIKMEYPSLALSARLAEAEFNSSFGTGSKNVEQALREMLKDRYSDFFGPKFQREMELMLHEQQITQDVAESFLAEVAARSKGEIPSPILETLLHYQFQAQPHAEFSRGFRSKYRTKGHPKSKGLDLQVEYPKSWASKEGQRPNVIQLFSNDNGRGLTSAVIMVRDIVKEANGALSRSEVRQLQTREGVKRMASDVFTKDFAQGIAEGASMKKVRDLKSTEMVLDNWPGVEVTFNGAVQRLNLEFEAHCTTYVVLYENYMIFLQFIVAQMPGESERSLQDDIRKFSPLFRSMANSLVIQSQY
jgi:hypothetical protein